MRNIEFVSYYGKYPNLCSGTLTLCIDGNIWSKDTCLISGGRCYINWDTNDEIVTSGPWDLDDDKFEEFDKDEIELIKNLVNENVPYGCCGGCI